MVWVNVDAALFSSSKRMGVGVVIRNHNGECLAACSELIPNVMTPKLAEALAVRHALALTQGEGYKDHVGYGLPIGGASHQQLHS
jgi:phosphotransferase system IIA component